MPIPFMDYQTAVPRQSTGCWVLGGGRVFPFYPHHSNPLPETGLTSNLIFKLRGKQTRQVAGSRQPHLLCLQRLSSAPFQSQKTSVGASPPHPAAIYLSHFPALRPADGTYCP